MMRQGWGRIVNLPISWIYDETRLGEDWTRSTKHDKADRAVASCFNALVTRGSRAGTTGSRSGRGTSGKRFIRAVRWLMLLGRLAEVRRGGWRVDHALCLNRKDEEGWSQGAGLNIYLKHDAAGKPKQHNNINI